MPNIDPKSIFSDEANIGKYVIEPLPSDPKPKDSRGFIYLVQCHAFPDYIKIGKTRDMSKRLAAYNQDRPVKSVRAVYISNIFIDVDTVEKRILDFMYKYHCTAGNTSEWFESKHYDKLLELIIEAETFFLPKAVKLED